MQRLTDTQSRYITSLVERQAANSSGQYELKAPLFEVRAGTGRVNIIESRRVAPGTKLRAWDFDQTITNAEWGHHLACELAVEETLNIDPRRISHTAWRKNFQPAFGLTTDETNAKLIDILGRHNDTRPGYAGFRHKNTELLKVRTAEQVVGALRREIFELFFDLADRHETVAANGRPHAVKLVLTTDRARIDHVINKLTESRLKSGLPIVNGCKTEQIRERKIEQLGQLRSWQPELLPYVWETLEASHRNGQMQSVVSSSDSWILERMCSKFGIRNHFALVTGADHVEHRKPHFMPHEYSLGMINTKLVARGAKVIKAAQVEVMEDSVTGFLSACTFNPEHAPVLRVPAEYIGRFVRAAGSKINDLYHRCDGTGKYRSLDPETLLAPGMRERLQQDDVRSRLHSTIDVLPCWSGLRFDGN